MERVSPTQGLQWIRDGWALLRLKPGIVIGSVLLMYLLLIVVQMLPHIGDVIAMLIGPFLSGGVYLIMQRVARIAVDVKTEPLAREQQVPIGMLFSVFKLAPKRRPLLGLAAVAMLFNIALVMMIVWFVIGHMGGLDSLTQMQDSMSNQDKLRQLLPQLFSAENMVWWLIILVFSVLYAMATLFAVPQIVLDGVGLVDALKRSFQAVSRNWLPFLTYGLAWLVLSMFVLFSFGLALIVLLPLGVASTYSAYRSIWPEAGDEGTTDEQSSERPPERSSTVM